MIAESVSVKNIGGNKWRIEVQFESVNNVGGNYGLLDSFLL